MRVRSGELLAPKMAASPQSVAHKNTHLWVALALTPGLGPTRGRKLVEHCGGIEKVFQASLTELEAAGLRAESAQSIGTGKSQEMAQEELVRAASVGAQIIACDHAEYPARLRHIYDPPLLLYVRGEAESLSAAAIAVVGTRHPTPYGLGMAERLACDLAARRLVIISGMARGVDSAAHRGALQAKSRTVAVFGAGIDVIYPRENKRMAEQILALGGALVSEFPLGTFAAPQNFPIRNRIISGMALGVLVIEAGEYSGTRITARCALEQGRELFAVPGNVTNRNSWGPNTLIKQGAKLTATWEDVWEELPQEVKSRLVAEGEPEPKPASGALFEDANPLTVQEKQVLAMIRPDEAIHIDELVERVEPAISSSELFSILFELELQGRIKQLPGKNFVRAL